VLFSLILERLPKLAGAWRGDKAYWLRAGDLGGNMAGVMGAPAKLGERAKPGVLGADCERSWAR
jgi:hypothetical protein